jgi:hypothetical protein
VEERQKRREGDKRGKRCKRDKRGKRGKREADLADADDRCVGLDVVAVFGEVGEGELHRDRAHHEISLRAHLR